MDTTILEIALLIMAIGVTNLLAFLIGARTAQKAHKGEEIELPNINPVKAYEEHIGRIQANKEQEELNTMLENINNYDGTALGQKDV